MGTPTALPITSGPIPGQSALPMLLGLERVRKKEWILIIGKLCLKLLVIFH
jgi:hypothetical protein